MMHANIAVHKVGNENAGMHNDPRQNIRELMKLRGIESERQLAARAGIDQSAFNRYMSRETQHLNSKTLQALAVALDATSSQLLGEVPLSSDSRARAVLQVMERLPDYLKDVLVETSQSLERSMKR